MITKPQLKKMTKWFYSYISKREIMMMSGWKLYVFGENIDDSFEICSLITPVAEAYDLTMKVASEAIINRNNMKTNETWSVAVIYLDPHIFATRKRSRGLILDLQEALKNYNKTGVIKGAKSFDGKIHYRYDLNVSVKPWIGVEYSHYLNMYRGGEGDYNIRGNDDIAKFFN